jgi:hypothetical protein
MIMKFKYIFFSVLLFSLTSCETDVEDPSAVVPPAPYVGDAGSADFSSYVSLGASNASGFMDNALFIAGQLNSFPNILAGAMAQAGGGEFTQPYVADNVGGMTVAGNEIAGERFFFSTQSFTPQGASGAITTEALDFQPGPYSNMSFPFVSAIHMVAPDYGNPAGLATVPATANPWFVRAASSPSARIIDDVLAQSPSFVTLVPGDDFNQWALFGGPSEEVTLGGATGMVAGVQAVIGALAANVDAGVITTLPDPSITPTFTTVPWNPIPLDAATAGTLNFVFNNTDPSLGAPGYNVILQLALAPCLNGIQAAGGNFVPADCNDAASVPIPNPFFEALSPEEVAARTIVYVEGNNPVLIVDENLTALSTPLGDLPKLRQTTENDKVSFGASVLLGNVLNNDPNQVWGVSVPAADNWILTADEIATLQSQLAAANDLISSSVPDGWALFDLAGLYEEVVTTGVTMDTYTMTSDYALGGFFGLDGYYPTARGNALIAKRMMAAIDAVWGSNLSDSGVNIGDYPTNFPDGI